MRIRKRIISAVTVSALGLGTIMIPHADAQVVGDSARLGGGQKIVLEGNPDAPTNTRVYTTSDGREWPMKLVPRRTNNANEYDANGEPIYDWKIVTKPGDFSTDYQLKWEAVAVVDPSLYDYSKQAFLQDFAVGDSPTWGQVQHWGDKNTRFWRPIMTSAEPLHNVKMTFTTSDKNSKFDFQTVNGTGFEASGHGQSQVRLVNDKENWLAYGELNYNSPAFTGDSAVEFDESIGARVVKGQDLPYGGKIINPGKQLFWNVVQIDDNTIEATIPYWPAGTHAVLQVRETLDAAGVDIKSAFATMRVTADKFHYEPTTVQQGSEKRVEPPVDYADPNYVGPPADTKFIRSAETPDWVEVDLDGKLTVSPDANVKPGDYQVPVVVRYPRVDGHAIPNVTIYAPVTVTPAAPVEIKPGSYDDAYVAPGDEVTVNLNYEANLPKGTQYSLVPPTGADADWEIAVDEETGRVIAKAPANAPSGRHSFKVIAKTPQPNSQEFEIDLNIHVDKQINGSDLSSGDGAFASLSSQSCVAAGLTVGLPLLFLIPVGLATQVNIPGLSPIVGQIQKELGKINSQAQQKLGIFDSQWADIARQLNLQSSNAGQVAAPAAGAIALVAAGLLVSDYLLKNCTPESTGLSAR